MTAIGCFLKDFFEDLWPYKKFTFRNLFTMLPIYIALLIMVLPIIMLCQFPVICIIDAIFSTQCKEAIAPFLAISLVLLMVLMTIIVLSD